MDDLQALAVALVICPRCEARAGVKCWAISEVGGEARHADGSHEPRLLVVRAAYSLGYNDADNGIDWQQPLVERKLIDTMIESGRSVRS